MVLWFVAPVGKFFGSLSNSIAQLIGVPLEAISVGFALFNRASGILLLATIAIIVLIRRVTQKPHKV